MDITQGYTWFYVAFLLAVYPVTTAIYRLYFHRLSKFPGPAWAAITEYWELYQDFFREEGGHLYLELDKLHDKYGPVVRIRPNEVHVKDSNWMHILYPGSTERRDRDPLVGTAIGTPLATIGTGPHSLHRIRKAAIAPFFSTRSVSEMEETLKDRASYYNQCLKTQVNKILDMRVFLFAWTTDFITGQIFGNSAGLFWDEERAHSYFAIMFDFSDKFPLTKHFPWLVTTGLALPLAVWKILFPSLVPYVSIYKDLLDRAQEACVTHSNKSNLKSKDGKTDIFETILTSDLPPEEKTPKRMANEVFNLLVAGSLTTAKTATYAVFHVLDNPDIYDQIRDELKEAIPDDKSMPSVRALQKVPILTAIIKETMRIGCIVTTRFPMISPNQDLYHDGQVIPAGASISMTYCKAGMDPTIFSEPNVFRPERWLTQEQKPHDFDHYVLPFGRGSRVCIGTHLAYAQLYLLLAHTFRFFDMELFETTRERDINIKGGGPLGEPTRSTKGVRVRVKKVVT